MSSPIQSQFVVNLNRQNIYMSPMMKEIIQKYADSLINYNPEEETEEEDETP